MDWFYCGFDWKLYDQFCEAILHLQVTKAIASEGLESFNLIFGFISPKAISGHVTLYLLILRCFLNSIIAKTIADFDEDNLIPFYGFGNGPTSFSPFIEHALSIVEQSGGPIPYYHVLLIIVDGKVGMEWIFYEGI
uniref:Copine C-terminal domain-containing protein n=1 Tax=Lactuca sativa TaxID=4236 RepID=A0A9R1V1U7_LACSA|nr:hypothetical protein LSAT_V11C700365030 [Lactuca sativa]